MKLRIDNMSADELWSLHEEIGKILSDRITVEKRELERRLAQLKGDPQINSFSEQKNVRPPRRRYPEVFPKYRNPETPHETWAGRGKQPRWMVAALKSGRKMEEFLIHNQTSDRKSGRTQHKSK